MNIKWNKILWLAMVIMALGVVLLISNILNTDKNAVVARIMLAAGCILIVVGSMFGGMRKHSPAFSGFGKKHVAEASSTITFADVAANTNAKNSLMGIVDYIKATDKYQRFGARLPKGVLLYGPPGTGKTLLARALAGEAGVPFFALSGSDFVQMYVGVGASRIRELFANARKSGKCVIFIDEIDALGKRRNDTVSEERDQTLNALLSEMSGFRGDEGIVVIAATNRIEAIDAALLRPGRFDRHIEVGLPAKNERREILELHCRNKPIADNVDLDQLANETRSFSGAALESLLNEAAILAAQRGSEKIESPDINSAFYSVVAGPDGAHPSDPDERCAIALHEAGHAIVLKRLMPDNMLKRISILSASHGTAGYNLSIPPERVLIKKRQIEDQITVLLAGRAAELLIGGEEMLTSGAAGDLNRAAELASNMIMELGMAGEPGVSMRAINVNCGGARGAYDMCREKLNEMYKRAEKLLEEEVDSLLELTDALLSRETLEAHEIDEVLNSTFAT